MSLKRTYSEASGARSDNVIPAKARKTNSALGLVVNVLVLWNTLYMDVALTHLPSGRARK